MGEGDCDGRGDGGLNDGDQGCKGDLVCGSNNCAKFGLYYHEKDDCCEEDDGKKVVEVVGTKKDVADIVDIRAGSVKIDTLIK